jgi:DNA-binding CsgD family transcriptional regulator
MSGGQDIPDPKGQAAARPGSSAADLAMQRAMADAAGLGLRKSGATPPPGLSSTTQSLAGEGISDTAELLRLAAVLKQAEADSGVSQRTIVIGEFSVVASRVPLTFIAGLQGLTRAEAAVLRMLGWGRSNADIAMLLDSAETTVRTHMNNVIKKLELDGMRELMCLAGLLFHPLD